MSRIPTQAQRWRRGTGVSGLLAAAARAHPERVFVEDRFGSSFTYARLDEAARRFASYLRAAGIGRGDRVVIHLQNRAELAVALFGSSLVGSIFTVLNARLRPKGLAAILAQAEPSLVVVDPDTAANLDGIETPRILVVGESSWNDALAREPLEGNWDGCDLDAACLVFTSGSTARRGG